MVRPRPGRCRFVCGAVSGGLECLEFEAAAIAAGLNHEYRELCEAAGLGDVLRRVVAGYVERTPTGGLHLLWTCRQVEGNLKLARELTGDPDNPIRVLIETRVKAVSSSSPPPTVASTPPAAPTASSKVPSTRSPPSPSRNATSCWRWPDVRPDTRCVSSGLTGRDRSRPATRRHLQPGPRRRTTCSRAAHRCRLERRCSPERGPLPAPPREEPGGVSHLRLPPRAVLPVHHLHQLRSGEGVHPVRGVHGAPTRWRLGGSRPHFAPVPGTGTTQG